MPMPRLTRKVHVGAAPGVLVAPTHRRVDEVSVSVFRYGPDGCEEPTAATTADLASILPPSTDTAPTPGVTWVNVVGLHDVELLTELGRLFDIHPLALEDVANVGQRPKVDAYDDSLYVTLRVFHPPADPAAGRRTPMVPEQISLFTRDGLVVTFQEVPGDCFGPVRERIRHGKGRLRSRGADYLTYALVDALVDSFYPVLEGIGETLEDLEEELIDDATPETQDALHSLRRNLVQLRRAAWPMREMTKALQGEELPVITAQTRPFLRDCHDHASEILELVESYREMAAGLQEVYLSSVSQKMNEVMKVLTIIATIFIPLTFIAGIYGMNFEIMPELHWPWAYPTALAAMAVLAVGLVIYFRRRGWM